MSLILFLIMINAVNRSKAGFLNLKKRKLDATNIPSCNLHIDEIFISFF
jgi:hypothetical protein